MPSEDDLNFDVLCEALSEYLDAKEKHDNAYAKYEGYSWGYFGNEYIETMENAREKVKQLFKEYLKNQIRDALLEDRSHD